jgi:hypothetical protein
MPPKYGDSTLDLRLKVKWLPILFTPNLDAILLKTILIPKVIYATVGDLSSTSL